MATLDSRRDFSPDATSALLIADARARECRHQCVGTAHILAGIVAEQSGLGGKMLRDAGVTIMMASGALGPAGSGPYPTGGTLPYDQEAERLLEMAADTAAADVDGPPAVSTVHMVAALLNSACRGREILLAHLGTEGMNRIQGALAGHLPYLPQPLLATAGRRGAQPVAERARQGKAADLPDFLFDLTAAARLGKLDPVVGRKTEIDRVVQILTRRTKNNPVLIGEPGVGKTAIAEGLAQRISMGDVPEELSKCRILAVDMGALIGGTMYRGDFEKRIKQLLKLVKDESAILLIDEVHTLVGAGAAEGSADAANILKPALARGEVRIIGATTLDEYRLHIERDAALERRFQPVMVDEPSQEETLEMLKRLRGRYQAHHGVGITPGALAAAVKLSVRFIPDRFLPDKAIDLVDEAGSRVAQQAPKTNGEVRGLRREVRQLSTGLQGCIDTQQFEAADILAEQLFGTESEIVQALASPGGVDGYAIPLVTEEDIAVIVASMTGIPVQTMTTPTRQRLLNLESDLRRRIIGQEHAVAAVARAIRRSHAGTRSPNRPIASFIFAGPTGVGKTELVKALAVSEFGDEESIIRLDMSEFMERHTVSKLIGAAPGYIGYEDGGQLTEAVRRRPYAVVLLDEVEKAHPDVFNLLLQVLDDGRLTDSQGRTVDFRNTVIVMTTNIGSRVIQQRATGGLGFEMSEDSPADAEYRRIEGAVHEELGRHFRPEFLNRLDEILVFRVLNREEVRQIAEILVREVGERLEERGIALVGTPRFIDHLATVGWNPTYGARPLRRAVMQLLEDCLAEAILRGEIDLGAAQVDWNPDEQRVVLSTSTSADLSVCR